jgi:predicted metal-dependent hydrolase
VAHYFIITSGLLFFHHVVYFFIDIRTPMYVIDYIIVHELAHLMEANHTPRFWNIVHAQAPAMEKTKAWLKENGQVLEEKI